MSAFLIFGHSPSADWTPSAGRTDQFSCAKDVLRFSPSGSDLRRRHRSRFPIGRHASRHFEADREAKAERGSNALLRIGPNSASVPFNYLARDREADARSLDIAPMQALKQ